MPEGGRKMSWSAAMCVPGNGPWAILSRHRRALEEEAQAGEIAYRLLKNATIASFTDYRFDSFAYSPTTAAESRPRPSLRAMLAGPRRAVRRNEYPRKRPVVRPTILLFEPYQTSTVWN